MSEPTIEGDAKALLNSLFEKPEAGEDLYINTGSPDNNSSSVAKSSPSKPASTRPAKTRPTPKATAQPTSHNNTSENSDVQDVLDKLFERGEPDKGLEINSGEGGNGDNTSSGPAKTTSATKPRRGQRIFEKPDESDDQSWRTRNDPTIGTILLWGVPEEGAPKKKQRRYVYRSKDCQEEPYYLSWTGNRMFLVDRHRIFYFPDGEEPESIRKLMAGELSPEEEEGLERELAAEKKAEDDARRRASDVEFSDDDAEYDVEYEGEGELVPVEEEDEEDEECFEEDPKVGTIILGIPTGDSTKATEKEKRYVYAARRFNDRPYYYSTTLNKIYVVDNRKIKYFPDGVEPSDEEGEEGNVLEIQGGEGAEGDDGTGRELVPVEEDEEEDEDEECFEEDPKVGTIILKVPTGDSTKATEKEKRYVYAAKQFEDRPYYFSTTLNKIYLVDKRRINYFPDGVEPSDEDEEGEALGIEGEKSVDAGGNEIGSDEDGEEEENGEEAEDYKVGTILLGVPPSEDASKKAKERRYVYCSPHCQDKPYYHSKTGNRMFVVNRDAVEYFPDGVEPENIRKLMAGELTEEEAEALEAELEAAKRAQQKKSGKPASACEEMMDVESEGGAGEDPKVGTILMRQPAGNGGLSSKKERRYVYCSVHCQDKPYYLSKTANRMFVVDKSRIEYFPDGVEPEEIRKEMENQGELSDQIEYDENGEVVNAGGEEEEEQEEEEKEVIPDQKIGTIRVKVAKEAEGMYESVDENGYTVLDVFCSYQYGEKPYYITGTKNKIYVVDKTRIMLDNPPPKSERRNRFMKK